jgi:hypothetical protein
VIPVNTKIKQSTLGKFLHENCLMIFWHAKKEVWWNIFQRFIWSWVWKRRPSQTKQSILWRIWFGCVRNNKMKSSISLSSALHSLDGTKEYIQRPKTSSNIIERNSKHEIWRRLNGYAFVITIHGPLDLVMSASRFHLIVDVSLGKESDDLISCVLG